ncbi:MAG: NAD-dependent epimerase/dehydratase family protein [Saprospiraceae bacterium]|jgi:nucleoside-diphosphate-sugar epimerase|nr:NAD-dependent epimerase/dehydratase family protein [Saprospiraceae bacterium]
MKLLITGGAGCLGSNLIERYIPLGHEICVIDNFSTGKREVVPETDRLTVVEGSVTSQDLVDSVMENFKPEVIIHSAASYKNPDDWEEDAATNVLGSIYVTKAAEKAGVKKIVNFQTALCYGRPEYIPIPVSHPTRPFTSYGISKTAGEAYMLNSNVNVVSLRLANICGPRLSIGPIPTFYTRLKQGKSCFCSDTIRDFIDIQDFFSLMDILLLADIETGVYNVSTGQGKSILDVFNRVADYLNISDRNVPIVPPGTDDVASVVLDPAHTEKIFNWKAKVSFENTIINQLKWYDQFGVNDVYSHLKSGNK